MVEKRLSIHTCRWLACQAGKGSLAQRVMLGAVGVSKASSKRRRRDLEARNREQATFAVAAHLFTEFALFGTLAIAYSGVRTTWVHLRSTEFWTTTVLQARFYLSLYSARMALRSSATIRSLSSLQWRVY